jgi:hypothetical protein
LYFDAKFHAQRSDYLVQGFHGWVATSRLDVAQGMHCHSGDLAQRSLVNPQHVAAFLDDLTYLLYIHCNE